MTDKTDYTSVHLCVDCMYAAEGVDEDLVDPPKVTPLSKFGETADLSADYCEDHVAGIDEECPNCEGKYGEDDDEGHFNFATFDCDGCESGLAGERFRYALWA
jgi:hypothetical protein